MHIGKLYHADSGDFGIIKIADSLRDFFDILYSEE